MENLDETQRRVDRLELILEELLQHLRVAQTWDQINVAAGIAHNAMHGGE